MDKLFYIYDKKVLKFCKKLVNTKKHIESRRLQGS